MKYYLTNFFRCGIIGWCIEILFTSLNTLRHKTYTLKGVTSLWMFPIYGSAVFLTPISHLMKNKPVWLRGSIYTSLIYFMEYLSGILLSKHKLCPWDYSHSKWNISKVIRLDYAPLWFLTGLMYERLLRFWERARTS